MLRTLERRDCVSALLILTEDPYSRGFLNKKRVSQQEAWTDIPPKRLSKTKMVFKTANVSVLAQKREPVKAGASERTDLNQELQKRIHTEDAFAEELRKLFHQQNVKTTVPIWKMV